MKVNKRETTKMILDAGVQRPCIKLQLDNVVFPKWSDIGLLGMMFRQCLRTKEQPEGNIYDEAKFQTVLRVIDGKLLISKKPDTYCWKFEKIEKAKAVKAIGVNSAEGILTMSELLMSVSDGEERKMLADMFASLNKDMLLVTTPTEERVCIEVTSELYDAGITCCVDEWMKTDADGNAEATQLFLGDFLIVSNEGVYRIGKDEFLKTHKLI